LKNEIIFLGVDMNPPETEVFGPSLYNPISNVPFLTKEFGTLTFFKLKWKVFFFFAD